MWELICHHTYKWDGRPVDLSPYNNPAETVRKDFLADAIAPSSGALRFFFPDTSVRVLAGEAWNKIGGIKIEISIPNRLEMAPSDTAFPSRNGSC